MIFTCTIETPLGPVTVAAEQEALTGLWFIGQKYYPNKKDNWIFEPDYPLFETLRNWLTSYFSGRNLPIDLKLNPQGTMFQKEVWDILMQIPFGQVITYGEIASKIALRRGLSSMSAQAVGGAVGHNPISILIPCHRVIGSDFSLTGYAGGVEKKAALLRLEGIVTSFNRIVENRNINKN